MIQIALKVLAGLLMTAALVLVLDRLGSGRGMAGDADAPPDRLALMNQR
jgi:hypothetical protein